MLPASVNQSGRDVGDAFLRRDPGQDGAPENNGTPGPNSRSGGSCSLARRGIASTSRCPGSGGEQTRFPRARVVVFVHAVSGTGALHTGPGLRRTLSGGESSLRPNRARDRDTDERLAQAGWLVVTVWELDDPEESPGQIVSVVGQ
jgi:hypothetical protein